MIYLSSGLKSFICGFCLTYQIYNLILYFITHLEIFVSFILIIGGFNRGLVVTNVSADNLTGLKHRQKNIQKAL